MTRASASHTKEKTLSQTAPESPPTQQAPQDAVPAGEAGQQPQATQGTNTPAAPPAGYVEMARYQGQVRRGEQDRQRIAELEQQLAATQGGQAQAPAPATPAPPAGAQTGQDGLPSMQDMVTTMFMDFASRQQDAIIERVLADPALAAAKPFRDSLGGTEAEVRQQAQYYVGVMQAQGWQQAQPATPNGQPQTQGQAPATPQATTPQVTTPVVPAGLPPMANQQLQGDDALKAQLEDILARGRQGQNVMGEYTAFKRQHPHIRTRPAVGGPREWEAKPEGS